MSSCSPVRYGRGIYRTRVGSDYFPKRGEGRKCGVPEESVPNSSAAFFISLSSSLCLSLRTFALGSNTASSSYGSSSSVDLAARAASFSASFAFNVPFFLGGAALETGAGVFFFSDSEFSQSLYRTHKTNGSECEYWIMQDVEKGWSEKTYDRTIILFILAAPSICLRRRLGGDDRGRRGFLGRFVVRSIPIRHSETDPSMRKRKGKSKKKADGD